VSETTPASNDPAAAEQISTKVVTAIADLKNVEPTELPPLYHAFDPDALDRLFHSKPSGAPTMSGKVSFTLAGCDVVVDSAQQVTVTPAESSIESDLAE